MGLIELFIPLTMVPEDDLLMCRLSTASDIAFVCILIENLDDEVLGKEPIFSLFPFVRIYLILPFFCTFPTFVAK